MNHPLAKLLLLGLTVWMVLMLLERLLGDWAVCLLVAAAGLLAGMVYMLRHHRPALACLYRRPAGKWVVDLVCRLTAHQPPVETGQGGPLDPNFMLREARDFDWAARKLRGRVIGHDRAIASLLASLAGQVELRRKSPVAAELSPIGIHLLVGPDGIGKQHLACSLAGLFYRQGTIGRIDLADLPDSLSRQSALLGNGAQAGQLLQLVRRHPHQVLLIENLQLADAALTAPLQAILRTGRAVDPATGSLVSFEHVTFVFTVTASAPRPNQDLAAEPAGQCVADESPSCEEEGCRQWLSEEVGLDPVFLGLMHSLGMLRRPSDLDTARVIACLMQAECARYGLEIDYIDPEILSAEVAGYRESHGFRLVKTRIDRQLRPHLLNAKQENQARLILTTDSWQRQLHKESLA